KNVAKDSYVPEVHVKAIGSRNGDFVSGQTDLRGVFVGDNLAGTSTVIAQADGGRYAFFRGKQELGPPPQQPPQAANAPAAMPPTEKSAGAEQGKPTELLLEQLQRSNGAIQMRNNTILDNNYKQQNKGVRAK